MPYRKAFLILVTATLSLSSHALVHADEVIGHSPDNTSGYMLEGWAASLVGGAAEGPAGAIAGGLIGA